MKLKIATYNMSSGFYDDYQNGDYLGKEYDGNVPIKK